MIEYINELRELGLLKTGLALGVIPSHIIGWYDIYMKYKAYVLAGQKKSDAVFYTALDCKINEKTVWRCIKALEREIKIKEKVS